MNTNDHSHGINPKGATRDLPHDGLDFEAATGDIPYNMTNDYMFRAVFQSSNKALRGLICSLLHLTEPEVTSVEITNPILLGDSVDSKEFRLDIHLLLNDHTRIDLEMQIANRLNWQNRSVMYLCRSYDRLNRGQDYREARPAIHVGFLDYTLFEDRPEFYAAYKLINIKSHQVYSEDLTLYVTDLSRIDLATEEDKHYHIDSWARLIKANTWEELRMTASENEALYEAAKALYYQSSDEEIRIRCLERAEHYQDLRNYERKIEQDRLDREQERLEHEQDLRNYERKIEQDRLDREQERMEHEQNSKRQSKIITEQAAQIAQLLMEIEQLKKKR